MRVGLLFILLFYSNLALAAYCQQVGQDVCVEGEESRIIEGYAVQKPCWKYKKEYQCYDDNYSDYCAAISNVPGCELIAEQCLESGQDGKCNLLEYKYKCGNLFAASEGVEVLDSEYNIVSDILNTKACDPYELEKHCYLAESKCVEPAQTRVINGHEVHKDCWRYEKKYLCVNGAQVNDCKEYEKRCGLVGERCLSKSEDGKQCYHTEKKYSCMKITGQMPEMMHCSGIDYCLWGDCQKKEIKVNNNMGQGIGYLSVLANLKNDLYLEDCENNQSCEAQIFKGEGRKCEKDIASSITKNCCQHGKTFLEKMKLMGCKADEELLADQRDKGLCHYIGSYCSNKVLGLCLAKKQSYCCFKSKLSRILQEGGRSQLGIGWGSPAHPDCRALSIEELKKIDFSKLDLSEIQNEVKQRMASGLTKHSKIPAQTEQQVKEKAAQALEEKDYQYQPKQPISEYSDEIQRRVKEHYAHR